MPLAVVLISRFQVSRRSVVVGPRQAFVNQKRFAIARNHCHCVMNFAIQIGHMNHLVPRQSTCRLLEVGHRGRLEFHLSANGKRSLRKMARGSTFTSAGSSQLIADFRYFKPSA